MNKRRIIAALLEFPPQQGKGSRVFFLSNREEFSREKKCGSVSVLNIRPK